MTTRLDFAAEGLQNILWLHRDGTWGWNDWNDGVVEGLQFTRPTDYFEYTLSLGRIPGHAGTALENYVYNPYLWP